MRQSAADHCNTNLKLNVCSSSLSDTVLCNCFSQGVCARSTFVFDSAHGDLFTLVSSDKVQRVVYETMLVDDEHQGILGMPYFLFASSTFCHT